MSLSIFVLEFLFKSTLVIAFGFVIVASVNKASPAFKHRLWSAIIGASLIMPVLLVLPRWEVLPNVVNPDSMDTYFSSPQPVGINVDSHKASVVTEHTIAQAKANSTTATGDLATLPHSSPTYLEAMESGKRISQNTWLNRRRGQDLGDVQGVLTDLGPNWTPGAVFAEDPARAARRIGLAPSGMPR